MQEEFLRREGAYDQSLGRPAFISSDKDFSRFSMRGSVDRVYQPRGSPEQPRTHPLNSIAASNMASLPDIRLNRGVAAGGDAR